MPLFCGSRPQHHLWRDMRLYHTESDYNIVDVVNGPVIVCGGGEVGVERSEFVAQVNGSYMKSL